MLRLSKKRLTKDDEIQLGKVMVDREKSILSVISHDISVTQEFTMAMGTADTANKIKPEDYYEFDQDINAEEAEKIIRRKAKEFINLDNSNTADFIANYRISRKMFHRLLNVYMCYHRKNVPIIRQDMDAWVEARDGIVVANLGLAFKMGLKMDRVLAGIEVDDLIAEGINGLVKAATLYRPDLPTKFCTMATWWVRQRMMKYVNDNSHTVRVPSIVSGNIRKYQRAVDDLTGRFGRSPTMEEITDHTKMSEDKIRSAVQSMFSYKESCDSNIEQEMRDESMLSGHEMMEYKDARMVFNNMLGSLTGIHLDFITKVYGLADDPVSKNEYAAKNGIATETVNTIEKEAMAILRDTTESGKMKAYPRGVLSVA